MDRRLLGRLGRAAVAALETRRKAKHGALSVWSLKFPSFQDEKLIGLTLCQNQTREGLAILGTEATQGLWTQSSMF